MEAIIIKVLFQGDSITDANKDNTKDLLGEGFVKVIKEAFPKLDIVNKGISGSTIEDLINRWNDDVIGERPNILFILIGVNDIWLQYLPQNYQGNINFKSNYEVIINDTIEKLKTTKIVLIEPFAFPIDKFQVEWTNQLKQQQAIVNALAIKYNFPLINTQSILDDALINYKMEDLLYDGIHPTKLGHELIAENVIKALTKVLIEFE